MTTQGAVLLIGTNHHRHRVPPDQRPHRPLHEQVARHPCFLLHRNRIPVGRIDGIRNLCAGFGDLGTEPLQDISSALNPLVLNDRQDRINPFLGLERIDVGG